MAVRVRMLDLGLRPYREVWRMQHAIHERVREGSDPDTWIFVEHPAVITLGRTAKPENVLFSREQLEARGIEGVEIERGGDVTYHGPGQLVVYPIRRLERFREIVPLVRSLEQAAIDACARFGVTGAPWSEHAGVWVGTNQIAAIGLAVSRMVSMHGIAFNACTQLDYDRLINPCGMSDRGVTSLARETGRSVSVYELKEVFAFELERTFGIEFESDFSRAVPVRHAFS